MLHITGKNDRLSDLKEKEGFAGTLEEYRQKFTQLNQNLCLKPLNLTEPLPSYTPLFPVSQPLPLDTNNYTIAREIGLYSLSERETLRDMQERNIEIPIVMASKNLLTEYSSHLSAFRNKLSDPIIQTPWKFLE